MGSYVRRSLICIWRTATLTFLPLLAVLAGIKYGNRCAFSLMECRTDCSRLFVFGIMFSSNTFASLYTTIYCCVIKCSKCHVNMVHCLVITVLLTKYLPAAEMLVCAAGGVAKHLFACSCASVSFHTSLSFVSKPRVLHIKCYCIPSFLET